jgi:ATP-dependent DNA ligase
MEAKSVESIPSGGKYLFEPKWDGFRCLAFRNRKNILLQSKAGQPLGRYFPELTQALFKLPDRFVLDGEIVIFVKDVLSFDDLLQRIHPAQSRIRKLSASTPATLMCFDLLVDERGKSLVHLPLKERRLKLEKFLRSASPLGTIRLSPASRDRRQALQSVRKLSPMGLDGIIAKQLEEPYRSGERTAMVKVKRVRTADCVVGGFRYAEKGGGIGSLLLGLNNAGGFARSRGVHVELQQNRTHGIEAGRRADCRSTRILWPGARRPEPLEYQTLRRVATGQAQAGLRSALRPFFRRPLPSRYEVPTLASRKEACPVHICAGHA